MNRELQASRLVPASRSLLSRACHLQVRCITVEVRINLSAYAQLHLHIYQSNISSSRNWYSDIEASMAGLSRLHEYAFPLLTMFHLANKGLGTSIHQRTRT